MTRTPVVTVGFDQSEPSKGAVRWAAAEALRRGARLRVLTVWDTGILAANATPYEPDWREEAIQNQWTAAEGLVKELSPDVLAFAVTAEGHPGRVLVETSRDSELLVVGSAGHIGAVGILARSVSRHVLLHAQCPVVVVGPEAASSPVDRVVVSSVLDPLATTFAFAAQEAQRDNAYLHLMDCWYVDPLIPSYPERDAELRAEAAETHARMLHRLRPLVAKGVHLTDSFEEGRIRDILQARTQRGDLIVLPRSAVHHAELGHLRCPVLVLPPHAPASSAQPAAAQAATSGG